MVSAPRRPRRIVWRVSYLRAAKLWVTRRRDHETGHYVGLVMCPFKAQAVAEARRLAKAGRPSQVVVHGKDGRVQFENTYGGDPERRPGRAGA